MAKRKPKEKRSWLVPMTMTHRGHWVVDAVDAEDAMAKANEGNGDGFDYSTSELTDWEVTGKPKLNE